MAGVKFDPTISTGNILSILAMLVTLTAAWVSITKTQEMQAVTIDRLETSARGLENRVRATEMTQAGQASDLRSIQATLAKIDSKIDMLSK